MEGFFTDLQLDKLSDILITVGEVLFASIVVPFFFGLDSVKLEMVGLAAVSTVISWVFSLVIVKGEKE